MNSVYIFGPIHLNGEDYLPVYKHLNKIAKKYFKKVISTYPDFWDSKEAPKQFYKRTFETITKCDLFVGEVSIPSSGVGMELQMAEEKKIPCIAVCKNGNRPSAMVLGLPALKEIIYYENLDDLSRKLEDTLVLYSNYVRSQQKA